MIFKTDFSQLRFIGRKFKNSGNLTLVFKSIFLLEPERITRFNTTKINFLENHHRAIIKVFHSKFQLNLNQNFVQWKYRWVSSLIWTAALYYNISMPLPYLPSGILCYSWGSVKCNCQSQICWSETGSQLLASNAVKWNITPILHQILPVIIVFW